MKRAGKPQRGSLEVSSLDMIAAPEHLEREDRERTFANAVESFYDSTPVQGVLFASLFVALFVTDIYVYRSLYSPYLR